MKNLTDSALQGRALCPTGMALKTIVVLLTLILAACSEDSTYHQTAVEPSEEDVVTVPIFVTLGDYDNEADTRAKPPGTEGSSSGTNESITTDDGYEETNVVDAVQLIAFRRQSVPTGVTDIRDDETDFVYDASNSQTLTAIKDSTVGSDNYNSSAVHYHRVAHGNLSKKRGYEYRIVALAYDADETLPYPEMTSKRVIGDIMTTNIAEGLQFKDFQANFANVQAVARGTNLIYKNDSHIWEEYLTGGKDYRSDQTWDDEHRQAIELLELEDKSKKVEKDNVEETGKANLTSIPQIFYGTVTEKGSTSPVIHYYSTDSEGNTITNAPLRGILYRGMAEVVLEITITPHENTANNYSPVWICLLADNIVDKVGLTSYDDFLGGYKVDIPKPEDNRYYVYGALPEGVVPYTAVAYAKCNKETSTKDATWTETVTLKAYLLPGKTHLGIRIAGRRSSTSDEYRAYNGQIQLSDITDGETATGVISTEVVNNVFYLKRNHKYFFKCNDSELILSHKIGLNE